MIKEGQIGSQKEMSREEKEMTKKGKKWCAWEKERLHKKLGVRDGKIE